MRSCTNDCTGSRSRYRQPNDALRLPVLLAQLIYEWILYLDAPTGKGFAFHQGTTVKEGKQEIPFAVITFSVVKVFLFYLAMMCFTEPKVFKVGTNNVTYYVVGRSKAGNLVGVKTQGVQT